MGIVSASRWLVLMLAFVCCAAANNASGATALPQNYAESVMLSLLSKDGKFDLSIRLARFPDRHQGHLWVHLATPEGAWSVVDENFYLQNSDATRVESSFVEFTAERQNQAISFRSTDRQQKNMIGHVAGTFFVNEGRHPEQGSGTIPMMVEIDFVADGSGFKSKSNRWELTGTAKGTVTLNGEKIVFDSLARWHEQTGPRKRFAPAFTYFNIQNESSSILAIKFAGGVAGYAIIDGELVGIDQFSISPAETLNRSFSVTLKNQQLVTGFATAVQHWSVPIEGTRRPGTSILVDSNLGKFVGALNDWQQYQ